jgi:ribosomal protein S18 acetylase RimI-like enzyme
MSLLMGPATRQARRVDVSIVTDGHWPDETDALLRALPEWFGIEESVRAYVNAARTLPTVAARVDGQFVGVCLVRRHTPVAAEIELLAVRRDLHRAGIGQRLVGRAVADLTASGVRLLQVKTLGPSGESEEYSRTRAFYEAIGFLPLEERTDIWGPANPCLFMVKPLP